MKVAMNEHAVALLEWLEAGAPESAVGAKFDMSVVWSNEHHATGGACGAVCCMAGFALAHRLRGDAVDKQVIMAELAEDGSDAMQIAGKVIGTRSIADAMELFLPDYASVNVDSLSEITSDRAAKTLRHYYETGEVNWDV